MRTSDSKTELLFIVGLLVHMYQSFHFVSGLTTPVQQQSETKFVYYPQIVFPFLRRRELPYFGLVCLSDSVAESNHWSNFAGLECVQ
jgi:hypothetical protein